MELSNKLKGLFWGLATATAISVMPAELDAHPSQAAKEPAKAAQRQRVSAIRAEVFHAGENKPYRTYDKLVAGEYIPPVHATRGDYINFTDLKGKPIIVDEKEMDLLVNNESGNPVKNPNRLPNRGERAHPAMGFNTAHLSAGVYKIFYTIENAASTNRAFLLKLTPEQAKVINESEPGYLFIDEACPPAVASPVKPIETPKSEPLKAEPPKANPPVAQSTVAVTQAPNICVPRSNGFYLAAAPFINLPKGLSPDYGIDLTLGKRFGKDGNLSLEGTFFLEPPVTRNLKTNIQRDEYTVRDMHLLGETNMETEWIRQAYGIMLGAMFGKPGHVNVGLRGGIGWENHNFSNKFIQTVTDMGTGKIIDTANPCAPKEVSKHNTFYRAELLGVIPINKDKFEFIFGYGIEGGRLQMMGVTYDNGRKTAQITMPGYAHSAVAGFRARFN